VRSDNAAPTPRGRPIAEPGRLFWPERAASFVSFEDIVTGAANDGEIQPRRVFSGSTAHHLALAVGCRPRTNFARRLMMQVSTTLCFAACAGAGTHHSRPRMSLGSTTRNHYYGTIVGLHQSRLRFRRIVDCPRQAVVPRRAKTARR